MTNFLRDTAALVSLGAFVFMVFVWSQALQPLA
jgi:hypothetical protein